MIVCRIGKPMLTKISIAIWHHQALMGESSKRQSPYIVYVITKYLTGFHEN